jgi:hypothetical protein
MKAVVWTAEANTKLREIHTYIGEHDPKTTKHIKFIAP